MREYAKKPNRILPNKANILLRFAKVFGAYRCGHGSIEDKDSSPVCIDVPKMPDTGRRNYTALYESELRSIAGIAALYGRIECSMNLFGLWTRGGRLIIQLVVAPGKKAIQMACYCEQDIEFFRRISEIIETRLGIQWNGEAHNHHDFAIGPSGGDILQVQRVTSQNNFRRWVDIITTFEDSGNTSRLFGRHRHNAPRWANSPQVRVKAFIYTDPQRGKMEEAAIRVLDGPSLYRQHVLATGLLDPGDIGEYASDFPMEKISYEPFDAEGHYGIRSERIPETLALAEQCSRLPEQARKNTNIYVDGERGLVTVAIPLPDGGIAKIAYNRKPTHLIKSINVQNNGDEDIEDVTEALLCDKRDISLNQIYEMLVLSRRGISTGCLSDPVQPERAFESLAEQTQQLPEQVQDDARFCVKRGIVTVTLPLPGGGTCHIGCDEKPPHTIQAVYVKSKGDEDTEDVSLAVLAGRHNIRLNQVYEILVERNDGKEEEENVDAETV